jgi:hypothetical protein
MNKHARKLRLIQDLKVALYGKKPSLAKHLILGGGGGATVGGVIGSGLRDLTQASKKPSWRLFDGPLFNPTVKGRPKGKKTYSVTVDPIEKALVEIASSEARGALIGGGIGSAAGAARYAKAMKPYKSRKRAVNLILAGLSGGALGALANKGKEKTASIAGLGAALFGAGALGLFKNKSLLRSGWQGIKSQIKKHPDIAALAVLPGSALTLPPYLGYRALRNMSSYGRMNKAISRLKLENATKAKTLSNKAIKSPALPSS